MNLTDKTITYTMDNFCQMCGNMMYIKNDEAGIIYYCKNCNFTRTPDNGQRSFCIHTNAQDDSMKYAMFLNPNIKYDPTLPHVAIPCTNTSCTKPATSDNDVIYMKYDHANMKYIYFCTYCNHFWKMEDARD
jgi:hypothetical protein